jgi:hypothetical protein
MLNTTNVLGFGAMALSVVIFFVWQKQASIKAKKAYEKDLADTAARNAAAWAADYHNPASTNYDPTRVVAENAAQLAAEAAAWLLDPHNPDSINYDPNA